MIKKILLITALFLCIAAVPAYAAIDECSVNSSQNSVVIRGTAVPNSQLLLTVVKKGASADSFFDDVAYQNQQTTNSNGQFLFDFKMKDAGQYTAYASTPEDTYTYDFVFSNADSVNSVIQSINASKSASEISAIIKENRYGAGLYIVETDEEPNYAYIAELIMSGKPYDTSDVDNVLKKFRQYLIYGYLKDKKIENVFTLNSYLDISSISGTEIFTEDVFKASHQLETTKRISGKSIRGYSDFANTLTEQMSLALIMNPNGYGNIEKVCKTFEERIGIDTSKANSTVYRSLYGKNFASFSDLKKSFNELCGQMSSGGNGGGSSSGGSGSGGSSNNTQGGFVTGGSNTGLEQVPIDTSKPVNTVFKDLDGYEWAVESIVGLYKKGIVSGRTEDTYAPSENITRSEFVKLVASAFNLNGGTGRLPFEDTSTESWDYPYIKAAYEAGVINGISSTEFGCVLPITRQDMAVILCRAAKTPPADDASVKRFADDNSIKDYAYNDVYALRNAGIISGDDRNMFNPHNTATRAEAARMIYAAIGQ